MSMASASPRQCVIWFGQPNALERSTVAAAGWQLRAVALQQRADIGLRAEDRLVAVLDLRERDPEQLEQLAESLEQHRHMALLAITAPAGTCLGSRIERLLAGCLQQFPAPLDLAAIGHCLQQVGDQTEGHRPSPLHGLLGDSASMLSMRAALHKFAAVALPVLVTGETGTGKEVAAHALHALSARAGRPFNAINCGAIPATLVQSELFGHERGAFTGAAARRLGLFETAQGGTVFLDEIGDLPLEVQTNLLRVLQEGTIERVGSHQPLRVDVRILAATHVDLEEAVAQGRFRRDLYYRLNVLRLPMPALRERGDDDIQLLARHFLQQFRRQHCTRARDFSADARQAMAAFDWPGNVRELINRVQRAAITCDGERIGIGDLELPAAGADGAPLLAHARTRIERETLLSCLQQSHYNISACARRMQLSRVTIYRLCRKHQLAPHGPR